MSGGFSWQHWLIVALVFVLFFGAKRLPDAARGLGRSLRIFKSEVSQMQNESAAETKAPAPAQELPAGGTQASSASAKETAGEAKTL